METLSATVNVFLFDPPVIGITASPPVIILSESSQLTVNQDPGYQYVWSSVPPSIIDPVYNPLVSPEETTTYTVTVTDENGCTGTASITVTVMNPFCDERDIFLPNAFTPNGDGENDILYVRSNFVTSLDWHIYNRWGQEVFSSNNISNGWNGTFNGEQLAPDVYGYYFNATCPNGKTYKKQGNITLLH
jgi:gliding motility-associated-like protein